MRWTMGLLLLVTAGCGYRQTRMVACPETGCPRSYASSSPQGLRQSAETPRVPPPPPVVAPPLPAEPPPAELPPALPPAEPTP